MAIGVVIKTNDILKEAVFTAHMKSHINGSEEHQNV